MKPPSFLLYRSSFLSLGLHPTPAKPVHEVYTFRPCTERMTSNLTCIHRDPEGEHWGDMKT